MRLMWVVFCSGRHLVRTIESDYILRLGMVFDIENIITLNTKP